MKRIGGICKILPYRFVPRWIPTIVTLLLLPVLISLGQWQSHRAEFKHHLQDSYDQAAQAAPLTIGADAVDISKVRYHRVKARGTYEPDYQILLDNQIYKGQDGYQVVTPLHLQDSEMHILVNRGWVKANGDRRILPDIASPKQVMEVSGMAMDPNTRFMELAEEKSPGGVWQKVWQNLDMKRYAKAVPFPVQPVVIYLDPESPAGGFVRDWPRPDAKVDMHKGYALQWRALALMLTIYYLITSIRRRNNGQTK